MSTDIDPGVHAVTIRGGRGIISPQDFQDYWDVLQEAFAIHLDREKIRDGLWKDYPAEDQANQIKIKIDRVLRSLELELTQARKENAISELHDVINYANFAIRLLRGSVTR